MSSPECDKLSKKTPEWNIIYPFIEWLQENRMCIAVWRDPKDFIDEEHKTVEEVQEDMWWRLEHPYPYGNNIEGLLYKYFGVDPNKLEEERRKILQEFRERSGK